VSEDILRRVPPQNLEAEQSVLGAILIAARVADDILLAQAQTLAEIAAVLRVEDFYRESHRAIFEVIVDLVARKIPADAITLTDGLRARGALETVGGPGYIAELAASVPTAANVTYYARIVREKSVSRSLASTATEIAANAYDAGAVQDVREVLADAERRIAGVSRAGLGDPEPSFSTAIRDVLAAVEEGKLVGIPTGFLSLDRALTAGGLSRGSLNVLAGTTSVGKTGLAGNIATRIPRNGTLFITTEMTRAEMIQRLIADAGLVDWSRIARRRPALITEAEAEQIAAAVEHLLTLQIEVLHRRALTPADVRREARLTAARFENKLDLIIVDYLQLMNPSEPQKRRDLEIASITKELKNLAAEFNVPVLLLSQLNREAVKTESGEPELWHLRDSGAIEQDADVVIFLWEPRGVRRAESGLEIAWKVAKQRNGVKCHLPAIRLQAEFTRFVEI
jgi:replicative DNA helicase